MSEFDISANITFCHAWLALGIGLELVGTNILSSSLSFLVEMDGSFQTISLALKFLFLAKLYVNKAHLM